jgi:hypothetical protein
MLDSYLEEQIKEECGLAFRGGIEKSGLLYNGNFLGLLEPPDKFDSFLANHIKHHGSSGSGKLSYLSKTIHVCDEVTQHMASKRICFG